MKIYIKNFIQTLKRLRPKTHLKSSKYNLTKYQTYPQGKAFFLNSIDDGILNILRKHSFSLSKNITSIGTCFAEEFSIFLKNNSSNYRIIEKNNFMFKSNWGRVYTPKNLRQVIEYSFQKNYQIFTRESKRGFLDPLRDYACGYFKSKDELVNSIKKHREISKEVLLNTDFIFITLGQTEGWIDKLENFIWGTIPSSMENFTQDRKNFLPIDLSFDEVLNDLNFSINILKNLNKNIKIFLTLSPVPSNSSFIYENVIISSSAAKAKLRTAIDQIVKSFSNVEYFPSYENVILDNSNFQVDNRHVKVLKKYEIFKVFKNFS